MLELLRESVSLLFRCTRRNVPFACCAVREKGREKENGLNTSLRQLRQRKTLPSPFWAITGSSPPDDIEMLESSNITL
jgi:hypothetical protein